MRCGTTVRSTPICSANAACVPHAPAVAIDSTWYPRGPAPGGEPIEEQQAAAATAETIATEFERADAYLLTAPFYNFGVSQHVKTWADVLLTDPRFALGQETAAGRPAYLVTARGGGYGPGAPRHG
ncbi:NAD(P)H-dependent oxidoreductase [Solicola gregarius]|uniref:NAD(P)H-dependent oxidoreductase n=1 Tax=Solicola gregarius TaxID=2908642 RepID=A0AA46TI09_9ACTN|nr:NAD(P)H-dependent oxidoreductase [Solicola gregarius]UYM05724.1 NAD(P)H-dependent oxidoreductase [Solicola gregarius]